MTVSSIAQIIIALLAGGVLFLLQSWFFRERQLTKRPEEPASFRRLDEIASIKRLENLSYLYALPLSLLFFFVAIESKPFLAAIRKLIGDYVVSIFKIRELRPDLTEILSSIPEFLDPLLILIAFLLLFLPYFSIPLSAFRNLVLKGMGLEQRANRLSLRAADDVLAQIKTKKDEDHFAKAQEALFTAFGAGIPLPEELVSSNDRSKLAYQLLYLSRTKTPVDGLDNSVRNCLSKIKIEPSWPAVQLPQLSYVYLAAAGLFYMVLCALYVLLVPLPADWLHKALIYPFFQPIEWPDLMQGGQTDLFISIIQRTLSFIIPLAIGMYLYVTRIHIDFHETPFQRFAVVFAVQFLEAIFVNLLFTAFAVAQKSTGGIQGSIISFGSWKIWEEVFAPSLAPGIALLTWILCSDIHLKWLKYLMVCLAAGACFYIAQYMYELLAISLCDAGAKCAWRGFYWHQFILGVFLMISYCCSALIAGDVLLPDLDKESEQVKLIAAKVC